jgi:hypothetical protein
MIRVKKGSEGGRLRKAGKTRRVNGRRGKKIEPRNRGAAFRNRRKRGSLCEKRGGARFAPAGRRVAESAEAERHHRPGRGFGNRADP